MAEALDIHNVREAAAGRHTPAGVTICAPAHHGITRAAGHAGWDARPPQQAGRLALAHCTLVDGIVLVSVYIYAVEGWSVANVALMRHLVEVLQALQHPWIDPRVFNMEPDELCSGSWFQRLRPLLAIPNQALHEQGGKWWLLPFFCVHPSLVGDIVEWSSWPGLV